MALDAADRGAKVAAGAQVEFLAELAQAVRGRGLEADEDAAAAGLPSQRHQFVVVGEIDGGLGNPLLAQLGLAEGAKEILGAGDVIRARADEVVVDDQNALLWNGGELANHVVDGTLPVLGAVEGRHAAEATIQGAAARGLDGAKGIALGQQILARGHEVLDRHVAAIVVTLQLPRLHVLEYLRPDDFGFLGHHRVHLPQNFVQAHGCVNATHHHGNAEAAKVRSDLIGPRRLRRERGDAHQIRPRHGRVVGAAQVLIQDGHFPLGRRLARQHQQTQRLPDTVAVPPILFGGDAAD